jgi:hypothetical protein
MVNAINWQIRVYVRVNPKEELSTQMALLA